MHSNFLGVFLQALVRKKITCEEAKEKMMDNFNSIISVLSENVSKSCEEETIDISVQILLVYQVHFDSEVISS